MNWLSKGKRGLGTWSGSITRLRLPRRPNRGGCRPADGAQLL